jgi:hypothetical protein
MSHRERAVILTLTEDNERLRRENRKLLKNRVTAQWKFEGRFGTLIVHRGAKETTAMISMTAWFYKDTTLDVMRQTRNVKLSNKFTRFLKEFELSADINYISLSGGNGVSLSHDSDYGRFFLSNVEEHGNGIHISEKEGLSIIRRYIHHTGVGIVNRTDRFPSTGSMPAISATGQKFLDILNDH